MLKISRIPTWEMENAMGYEGVWVIRAMDYKGVDCRLLAAVVHGGVGVKSIAAALHASRLNKQTSLCRNS